MGKVSIVSLGCPKNRVDSDTLMENLMEEGFLCTPEPSEADLIFINTCGFIEDAKRESIEEILKAKEMKGKGKKLLVFGCLAQRHRDELRREIPEIDALWGVGEEEKIVEYCKKIRGPQASAGSQRRPQKGVPSLQRAAGKNREPETGDYRPPTESHAYLKVAEGCNRGCTFCAIPFIRGPFRSGEPDAILRKAEEHIISGAKELVLVAQDIGSYGRELKGYNLPALLKDMSSISGDFWIRLLYLYPTAVTDELLSVLSEEEKVCKYLDIPLQHSEDRVLKAMGRGGTKAWYVRAIKRIREAIPDITLRTTMIVGFPGEREDDFAGLRKFVEDMRFDRLGVFLYSKEEGTPAYRLKGSVPKKIKERRRDEIMRVQSGISLEKNKALVGKRFSALVDEVEGGTAVARLASQAPEIDGVVFIGDDGSPLLSKLRVGDFVTVEITGAYDYDMVGMPTDDLCL